MTTAAAAAAAAAVAAAAAAAAAATAAAVSAHTDDLNAHVLLLGISAFFINVIQSFVTFNTVFQSVV